VSDAGQRVARWTLSLAGLAVAFVVATVVAGWWGVPAVAFAWGAWAGGRSDRPMVLRAVACAAFGAAMAWAGVLAWMSASAPVVTLADTLGRLAGAPGTAIVLITLAFGAALGASAAAAGAVVGAWRAGAGRSGR
jgi:hypothetical protein